MKFTETDVYGFRHAMRGMRNAMDSHKYADTQGEKIGEKDLLLAQKLSRAGAEHAKYLRHIEVWVDIKTPLYIWKHIDTYQVGTSKLSDSTMHCIHKKEFTPNDFASDALEEGEAEKLCQKLNKIRKQYLAHKTPLLHRRLIQTLGDNYIQKRSMHFNYQTIKNMYWQRKNHRMKEWREDFVAWAESLPYFKELCIDPIYTKRGMEDE